MDGSTSKYLVLYRGTTTSWKCTKYLYSSSCACSLASLHLSFIHDDVVSTSSTTIDLDRY